jgi:hypothetical protein
LYSYLDLPFSAVLVFFLPNGVNNGRWSNCNCVHYFAMCPYEIIEKEES